MRESSAGFSRETPTPPPHTHTVRSWKWVGCGISRASIPAGFPYLLTITSAHARPPNLYALILQPDPPGGPKPTDGRTITKGGRVCGPRRPFAALRRQTC